VGKGRGLVGRKGEGRTAIKSQRKKECGKPDGGGGETGGKFVRSQRRPAAESGRKFGHVRRKKRVQRSKSGQRVSLITAPIGMNLKYRPPLLGGDKERQGKTTQKKGRTQYLGRRSGWLHAVLQGGKKSRLPGPLCCETEGQCGQGN